MSLYLAIFDGDNEITGWVFGHYSDFGVFRDTIKEKLSAKQFPTLMNHPDCDGEWLASDLPKLKDELQLIAIQFKKLPPESPQKAFEHTAEFRKNASTLYDCFHNVDGENIFEALIALCDEGLRLNKSILFQ
jgi:immunity protein 70 of polymorphic toxin system